LLRKTCNDGNNRTDSGKLFQTDAAVAGKVRSPMVKRTVRGATSADVVEERSHDMHWGVTRAEDLKPGSQVQISCQLQSVILLKG